MRSPASLAECFVAHMPPAARVAITPGPELNARLNDIVARARAVWPQINVPDQDFVAYIASRLDDHELAVTTLDDRCFDDLLLACGCAKGDRAAIEAFERGPLRDVSAALRRSNPTGALVDEVHQRVAELLLVGRDNRPPRIEQYAGRGRLRAWVRVIAMREANKLRTRHGSEQLTNDDSLFDAAAMPNEPGVAQLKDAYQVLFKQAFHEAVAALSIHDRLLLRQHFLDGLSIDQLAALHKVHRATTARWLARLRQTLLEQTRRRLRAELQLDGDELDSVMRLIDSKLDASVSRVLRD